MTCAANNYQPGKNDTADIIYEALLRTIGEQLVPDFPLLKDKKNILVLDTYFKPHCSGQNTSAFDVFKNVHSIPYLIGNTRFCLKSREEVRAIANAEKEAVTALQIGFITINGDTAITGMSTSPVAPVNYKRVILSGGGCHFKFRKIEGKWVYTGRVFCDWIS